MNRQKVLFAVIWLTILELLYAFYAYWLLSTPELAWTPFMLTLGQVVALTFPAVELWEASHPKTVGTQNMKGNVMIDNARSLSKKVERARSEVAAAKTELARLQLEVSHSVKSHSLLHALETAKARVNIAEESLEAARENRDKTVRGL